MNYLPVHHSGKPLYRSTCIPKSVFYSNFQVEEVWTEKAITSTADTLQSSLTFISQRGRGEYPCLLNHGGSMGDTVTDNLRLLTVYTQPAHCQSADADSYKCRSGASNISFASALPFESEYLYKPGSKFRVMGMYSDATSEEIQTMPEDKKIFENTRAVHSLLSGMGSGMHQPLHKTGTTHKPIVLTDRSQFAQETLTKLGLTHDQLPLMRNAASEEQRDGSDNYFPATKNIVQPTLILHLEEIHD